MMGISASAGDLSDSHLRRITQLGVGAIDFGEARDLPGVRERGYPDLDALIEIKKRVRSWGLDVNRGTLPAITQEFMRGEAGTERELDDAVQSLRVFGDAGMTLASHRFEGSNSNHLVTFYRSEHRGGYIGSGASAWRTSKRPPELTPKELQSVSVNDLAGLLARVEIPEGWATGRLGRPLCRCTFRGRRRSCR